MNTFKQNIEKQITEALKSNQTNLLVVLRDIKSQLINGEKEKGNNNQELDEIKTLKVLEKMAKSRKQSIDLFKQGNREDLAEKEIFELSVIESYLPKKLGSDEIKSIVQKIITENSFTAKKDVGNVIKKFNENYAGQSDGKTISDLCKDILV